MKRIRIGNDINIEWSVKRYGQPENFYGRNLILKMVDPNNREHAMEFTTEGNVIRTTFLGMNQELCGSYALVLVENSMEVGMTTIDKTVAFILVPHSYMESGVDPDGITTTSDNVNIETEITLPADGLSAYEIAVKNGYEGSEQEWLQSLVGAPGVDGSDADVTKENIEKALGYVPDSGVGQMMIAEDETVTGKKTFVGQIGIENTDLDKNGGVILRSEPYGVVNKTDQLFVIGTKGSANIKVERDPVDDLELATRRFVIKEAKKRQAKLTAGYGITIDPSNRISVSLDLSVFKVVTVLPEYPASGDENKIHLIPASKSAEQNIYTEYVYVNGVWEKLGEYNPAGGGLSEMILSTTYSNLVSLRDSNRLIPGMQYRITDYDFTTTEADTDSAHLPFDIIVTADSESVLNESARAIHHQYAEGEEDPLSSRDIAAWKLKYTLKNIKHSSSDGKGTILWMKDESRNECYYDFINALFRVYKISACPKSPTLVGTYAIKSDNSAITYETNSKWVPTFGSGNHDNIIRYYGLAKIVLGQDCYFNTFGNNCHSNTFGGSCHSNTFRNNCYDNVFGNSCYYNVFWNTCGFNTFGDTCGHNIFGGSCFSNTLGKYCFSNIFWHGCSSNTLGDSSNGNTLGSGCEHIKTSLRGCSFNRNSFGDGCRYIEVRNTSSPGTYVQNYNFSRGLEGKKSSYIVIEGEKDRNYETYVSRGSDGSVKIYCLADIVTSEPGFSIGSGESYPYSASFIGEI